MKLGDHSEFSDMEKKVKKPNFHILVNFRRSQGRYNGEDKSICVGDRNLAMTHTAWSLSPQRTAAVVPQLRQPARPAAHCALPPPYLQ